MRNTPAMEPPGKRLDSSVARPWIKLGICNSYTPNMDSAMAESIKAKPPSTHGFCKAAASPSPARPAATPNAAYTKAMPSA
jgi:hypothetical protein